MPPKKEDKKKDKGVKQADDVTEMDDGTGITKNLVIFTFQFEITKKIMEDVEETSYLIMWDFVENQKLARFDTPLFDSWTADGENKIVYEKVMDKMIIDDVPTITPSLTPPPLSTSITLIPTPTPTQLFCQNMCNKQFYIQIIRADDFMIKQEIFIDYSQILSQKNPVSFVYTNNKMKILEIENFTFSLQSDITLLQSHYRKYLNPLEIDVIGAKNLPVADSQYQPIYVQYKFYDYTVVKTPGVISNESVIKWRSKHVFLLGLMDQKILIDDISSKFLELQLHDCDKLQDNSQNKQAELIDINEILNKERERLEQEQEAQDALTNVGKKDTKKGAKVVAKDTKKETKKDTKKDGKKDSKKVTKEVVIQDPIRDPKDVEEINDNHYGVAAFHLQDLLNQKYQKTAKQFQLRSPIIPIHKLNYLEQEKQVLDLNKTATQNEKINNNNYQTYFECDSFLVISIKLECNIDSYVKPVAVKEELQVVQQVVKGKQVEVVQEKKVEAQKNEPVDLDQIYERCIFQFPYKNAENIIKLQEAFYKHNRKVNKPQLQAQPQVQPQSNNLQIFKIETEDYQTVLKQKILSSAEKSNRNLNFLGGFEIYDEEFRLYIIEGLSEEGISDLMQQMIVEIPNTYSFKIFRNKTIKFPNRLYLDFNCDIKKIKLRDKMENILKNQKIYIRSKYPDAVRNALFKVEKIKRQQKLSQLVDYDLFPLPDELIEIEKQLSMMTNAPFDLYGQDVKKKVFVRVIPEKRLGVTFKGDDEDEETEQAVEAPQEVTSGKKAFLPRLNRPHLSHSKPDLNFYSLQIKERLDPGNYFTYSSQRKNIYAQQMEEIEQKAREDKNNFYTYSQDYLTLSICPKDTERMKQLEIQKQNERLKLKQRFSVNDFNIAEKRRHFKHLNQDQIDSLHNERYHEYKALEQETTKQSHGVLLKDHTKEIQRWQSDRYFSDIPSNRVFEPTFTEREEMDAKELKRQMAESKSKLIGAEFIVVKKYQDKNSQLDKYKNLLEGKANRKGLVLGDNQIKSSTLSMQKQLGDMPVSIFFDQEYVDYIVNPFDRKDQKIQ